MINKSERGIIREFREFKEFREFRELRVRIHTLNSLNSLNSLIKYSLLTNVVALFSLKPPLNSLPTLSTNYGKT